MGLCSKVTHTHWCVSSTGKENGGVTKLQYPLYLCFHMGCVSCIYYGRKHMLRTLAGSRIQSKLRIRKNDGSASCIMGDGAGAQQLGQGDLWAHQ